MKKLYGLLVCSLMAATASAHNLFPAQTDNGYTIRFWADDHWEEPDPQNVIGLTAYDVDKRVKVGYDYTSGTVIAEDGSVGLMTAEYDFGYFTFTADKHFHKPRTEVEGVIFDTRHIYKLGKGIFQWDEAYSKPVGMKIEVTPLHNPLKLKEGDKLKVLVTLDGKPYAGAEFEDQVGDIDGLTTDKDGIAEITLRTPQDGYEIIGASVKLPYQLENTQAQTLQLTGTLGFKPH
ncbi:DUF4198 domain-containing protein [Cardiobacteriaceae bacterium TAE3-ERU3]|nr:DUF4198 domain-containing protein [Cardiobacteriaceae bacterium TAE3-ERU3]